MASQLFCPSSTRWLKTSVMSEEFEAQPNKRGRPLLYDDPLKLEQKIEQYFDQQDDTQKPYTISGLCYFLGFSDRGALNEYAKRDHPKKDDFSRTVNKAKLKIASQREEKLVTSGSNTGGIIFDLVNNFGYRNPQHIKHSGDDEEGAKPIEVVTRRIVRADNRDG